MWSRLRNILPILAAVLGIVSYGRSFQKDCVESSVRQCIAETFNWYGEGVVTARTKDQVARTNDQPPRANEAKGKDQSVAQPPTPAPAPAPQAKPAPLPDLNRRIVVANVGDETLDNFYATACSVNTWGRDLLGAKEVIEKGKKRMFDLDDGTRNCCFDLRVVYRNKVQINRLGVDACTESQWTVKNN